MALVAVLAAVCAPAAQAFAPSGASLPLAQARGRSAAMLRPSMALQAAPSVGVAKAAVSLPVAAAQASILVRHAANPAQLDILHAPARLRDADPGARCNGVYGDDAAT
jgi:hypothetical protein